MSRLFGWSYPPGCSGPPEDSEPFIPRCVKCHSFLKHKADDVEVKEQKHKCNGNDEEGYDLCGRSGKHEPHEFVIDTYVIQIRICKRCNHKNQMTIG